MRNRFIDASIVSFVSCVSLFLHAQETIINPNAGGLKKTFEEVDGKSISHPMDYPQDGKGTARYLKEVCRSLGHDEIVSFHVLKASSYDSTSQQWVEVEVAPRIYKSITCTVYLK